MTATPNTADRHAVHQSAVHRNAVDWIAVDWGTSNLRVWALAGERVAASASSPDGMGRLTPGDYEAVLTARLDEIAPDRRRLAGGASPLPVLVCGMAGARQGWCEAPYVAVPARPPGLGSAVRPPTRDPGLDVRILPGLRQDDPPDVIRGEETQVAGFLADAQDYEGIICLPGTHTKWVQVTGGRIVAFRTTMTGEVFDLLSTKSILRHSMVGDWSDAAFLGAVDEGLARPNAVWSRLFPLRAADLLSGRDACGGAARLSGLLIGAELACLSALWSGMPVTVIGAAGVSRRYREALSVAGMAARLVDGDALTLAGLIRARDV